MKKTQNEIIAESKEILSNSLFVIQINYKSGISVVCVFTKFTHDGAGDWSWETPPGFISAMVKSHMKKGLGYDIYIADQPLRMGVDWIESVFIIETFVSVSQFISEDECITKITDLYSRMV